MKVAILPSATVCLFFVLVFTGSTSNAQVWGSLQKETGKDIDANAQLGNSIALAANYALAGAPAETKDSSGIQALTDAGAAYLFAKQDTSWVQKVKLVADDRATGARFGNSVALSTSFALVGATHESKNTTGGDSLQEAGAVYVYRKNGSDEWIPIQKIVAPDRQAYDQFGSSIAISTNFMVIGAANSSTDANGSFTMSQAGAAYVYEFVISQWIFREKLVASDRKAFASFGHVVKIDGGIIAIAAPNETDDDNGQNSYPEAGAVYIFEKSASIFSQTAKLIPQDRDTADSFGVSMDLSGTRLVIGADREDEDENNAASLNAAGSAYIFQKQSGNWIEKQKLVANDRSISDRFGNSVAIGGQGILIGAFYEDHNAWLHDTLESAGSVYLFKGQGGTWNQADKWVPHQRAVGDLFGFSVAMSDTNVLISSPVTNGKDSNGNTVSRSGAVYFWEFSRRMSQTEWETTPLSFQVYPNPSSGLIILKAAQNFKDEEVFISDLNGKVLFKSVAGKTNETSLNLHFLPKGMYLISIKNSNNYKSNIIVIN